MSNVLVITPTTGSEDLIDAIESVKQQTYLTDHLIVVDGTKFSQRTNDTFSKGNIQGDNWLYRVDLPFNTGQNNFYGHRIMAAFGHLIDHEYVLFLDQDNWFEKEHVEKMMALLTRFNYDWVYSLRKIYDKEKNYLVDDNCESLGRWPVYLKDDAFLIDSSSYCFKTEFFRKICHLWDFGWGADRRFYTIIKNELKHKNYGCTGDHTLCYRLGGNDGSVTAEFFEQGNKKMKEIYGDKFPWINPYL